MKARCCSILACLGLAALCMASPARAFRPFDGTDAGVAEPGAVEIEAGVGRLHEGMSRSYSAPELVGTLGVGGDSEIGLEGRLARQLVDTSARPRTSIGDTGLMFKHVFRHGVLQGAQGVSLAAECGVLLPEVHADSGSGLTCTGAASNRSGEFDWHLNAGLTRTRDHTTTHSIGVIVQGPQAWTLRPATELRTERDTSGAWAYSALFGAVYRKSDALQFDIALRFGRTSDGKLDEIRVGLTWSL
jgi:hypothetical protein